MSNNRAAGVREASQQPQAAAGDKDGQRVHGKSVLGVERRKDQGGPDDAQAGLKGASKEDFLGDARRQRDQGNAARVQEVRVVMIGRSSQALGQAGAED